MIHIDGSFGEGGGQVVRTSLAFSTLMKKECSIFNIRKGRPVPGLKSQHLYCIDALKGLCNARSNGADIGSEKIDFSPQNITGGNISIDIRTAGSITLLLQSILLPSLFADSKVRLKIRGGTDVKWAMPIDYFKEVVLPYYKIFGKIELDVAKRGYFPKGQGIVDIKIRPKYHLSDYEDFNELRKEIRKGPRINIVKQGILAEIFGTSHASEELKKAEVVERQINGVKRKLSTAGCKLNIAKEYCSSASIGSGISLFAEFDDDNKKIIVGADALGEKGKKAEAVGKEAAERLSEEIGSKAPIDSHLADNILPVLAITGGKIRVSKITDHTKTNAYMIEQFLGKTFNINEKFREISGVHKVVHTL